MSSSNGSLQISDLSSPTVHAAPAQYSLEQSPQSQATADSETQITSTDIWDINWRQPTAVTNPAPTLSLPASTSTDLLGAPGMAQLHALSPYGQMSQMELDTLCKTPAPSRPSSAAGGLPRLPGPSQQTPLPLPASAPASLHPGNEGDPAESSSRGWSLIRSTLGKWGAGSKPSSERGNSPAPQGSTTPTGSASLLEENHRLREALSSALGQAKRSDQRGVAVAEISMARQKESAQAELSMQQQLEQAVSSSQEAMAAASSAKTQEQSAAQLIEALKQQTGYYMERCNFLEGRTARLEDETESLELQFDDFVETIHKPLEKKAAELAAAREPSPNSRGENTAMFEKNAQLQAELNAQKVAVAAAQRQNGEYETLRALNVQFNVKLQECYAFTTEKVKELKNEAADREERLTNELLASHQKAEELEKDNHLLRARIAALPNVTSLEMHVQQQQQLEATTAPTAPTTTSLTTPPAQQNDPFVLFTQGINNIMGCPTAFGSVHNISTPAPSAPIAPTLRTTGPPGLATTTSSVDAWRMEYMMAQTKGKLTMPDLPTPATTPDYQASLATNLAACAKYMDGSAVLRWISQVWEPGQTLESLRSDYCERHFTPLDAELCSAAQTQLKKPGVPAELKRHIDKCVRECVNNGRLMSGRQCVFMILNYNRTDNGFQKAYTIENLMNVAWLGDEKADIFLQNWDQMLANMAPSQRDMIDVRDGSSPTMQQALFAKQFAKTRNGILRNAWYQYVTAETSGDLEIHSLGFLRKAVEGHVERTRMTKQQQIEKDELQNLGAGKSGDQANKLAAAATAGGGKGGKRGGGTGKKGDTKGPRDPTPDAKRKENGPCYWHVAHLNAPDTHPKGCLHGQLCRFSHDSISKEAFLKLPKPKARTPSPGSRKGGGKGGGKTDNVCKKWRATGECPEYKANTCDKLHYRAWAGIGQDKARENAAARDKGK